MEVRVVLRLETYLMQNPINRQITLAKHKLKRWLHKKAKLLIRNHQTDLNSIPEIAVLLIDINEQITHILEQFPQLQEFVNRYENEIKEQINAIRRDSTTY